MNPSIRPKSGGLGPARSHWHIQSAAYTARRTEFGKQHSATADPPASPEG